MTETIEVMVGVIGRAHGIRGEVAVEPRTDEPERRFAPGAATAGRGIGAHLHRRCRPGPFRSAAACTSRN